MMDFIKAYAIDGDPNQLAFSVKNAAKDVGYYVRMAEEAGVESIMSEGALRALKESMDAGRAETLVPEQVDFFAAKFGV